MAFTKNPEDLEKQPLLVAVVNPLSVADSRDKEAGSNKPAEHPSKQHSLFAHAASLGLSSTTLIIIYYAFCSSTMLVINKVAVEVIPAPSFLMFCQMAFSAAVAYFGGFFGVVEVDPLEATKVRKFTLVVLGFLGCIFSNIKVLQNSNVETFITFRSSTPLVLSFCDYLFLGRALPNMRSWMCLVVLLAGSVGYVLTDTAFKVDAYYWLGAWYAFFVFDCVYVKHMCDSVRMTNWGRVYYTNLLTLPFLLAMFPLLGEPAKLEKIVWSIQAVFPLVLSCLVGVCMSHASYLLREACSATLFTVVGIICKVGTVIINYFLWDKHASLMGISFLMVCVMAGTFYQQAPKRVNANGSPLKNPSS